MENPTVFDLNEAIRRWQKRLSDSPAFADGNLEELESHLRASLTVLKAKGLSEEEAFLIALRRLGDQFALEQEFAKVNAGSVWLTRGIWMLVGIVGLQIIELLSSSASLAASILLHLCLPSRAHVPEIAVRDIAGLASEGLLIALALRLLKGRQTTLAQWFYRHLSSPWQAAIGLLLVVVCMEAFNYACFCLFARYVSLPPHLWSMSMASWNYVKMLTTVLLPPVALGLLICRRIKQNQVTSNPR